MFRVKNTFRKVIEGKIYFIQIIVYQALVDRRQLDLTLIEALSKMDKDFSDLSLPTMAKTLHLFCVQLQPEIQIIRIGNTQESYVEFNK